MAEALRRLGSCFVDLNLAEKRLRFIQNAYPTLASAIGTEQYTNAQIARVLRRLVAEGISIVNGRLIFDLLVKHASARRDERRLLECVRAGLGRVIRHKLARGTDPVTVYLLDPRVEERLAKQRWRRRTDETLREAILSSVRTEIRELERTAPTAIVPSILTTIQARSAVKAVLQDEFPRLAVICYQDLPRDTNIQPIARLLLA
jgi:type III secretory pathway component EscV